MTSIWGSFDHPLRDSAKLDLDADLDVNLRFARLGLSAMEITPSVSETSTVISPTASSGNLLSDVSKGRERGGSANSTYTSSSANSTPGLAQNISLPDDPDTQQIALDMLDLIPNLWADKSTDTLECSSFSAFDSGRIPFSSQCTSSFATAHNGHNSPRLNQSSKAIPAAFNNSESSPFNPFQQLHHNSSPFSFAQNPNSFNDSSRIPMDGPAHSTPQFHFSPHITIQNTVETTSLAHGVSTQSAYPLTEENLLLLNPSKRLHQGKHLNVAVIPTKMDQDNTAYLIVPANPAVNESDVSKSSRAEGAPNTKRKDTQKAFPQSTSNSSHGNKSHKTFSSSSAKSKGNVDRDLYKTEMCTQFQEKGSCPYGAKCQFAHGTEELKKVKRADNWKTKLCANWLKSGSCRYGKRCCFKHGENDRGNS
ncbi:hypothetical protein KL921_001810 [Ogataea angusta]|uniref:C3H1-type domain-containing protein n=1 Tax=Pichia angusta TaxID=870730 RepID=A0AAN6DIN3_PICAN|nr:uncharacterized protein KL928_001994 [Ogataea angusta]KAG7811544.1 hypothetical protein KL921_001810 [Ogataea angusta]KAG7819320.1 hypothetical protein KL928_001994 [Ogataea angusta]KAG7824101.1 hypothetical protein KL909_002099 [Ogataea angusta]KAG7831106.1 hypothetical protein KL920_001697 [Ogataea angusta]KAG7835327.1 hypothetical protein KL943_002642 [Ogataea angusta]